MVNDKKVFEIDLSKNPNIDESINLILGALEKALNQ